MTILSQLIAKNKDTMGYITYVFKCLDEEISAITKYIMCVRYPNWNHGSIKLGEIGFLTFKEVKAGESTWYNGKTQIPYKYDAIQFLKFISKPTEIDHEYIM